MNEIKHIDELFKNLESKNDSVRFNAFKELIAITDNKVSWIYDKWFILLDKISSTNSYQRSIGLMLIANLCKSDLENRTGSIIDKYLDLFDDEKFITSRQAIQNVWKIALMNESNKRTIINYLEKAYSENIHLSKHGNLIKQDIISSLFQIFLKQHDDNVMKTINEMIDSEIDDKFRKTLLKITTTTLHGQ